MDMGDLLRRGGVYDTIQARIRYWWDGELNREADAQEIRRNPYAGPEIPLTAPGAGGGPAPEYQPPPTLTYHGRLWLEGRRRWRSEERQPGKVEPRISIANADAWWLSVPNFGIRTGAITRPPAEGEPGYPPWLAQWLNPVEAPEIYRLERGGDAFHIGRAAVRLWAIPHDIITGEVLSLWPGADRIELLLDAERGVLLYAAGYIREQIFAVFEVESITFDQPLDARLFAIPPANPPA